MAEQQWKPGDWKGYFDAVAGKPPRETLLAALARFEEESRNAEGAGRRARDAEERQGLNTGSNSASLDLGSADSAFRSDSGLLAVDIGCGEGRDAAEMLARGWRVVAVDSEAEGLARLKARVPEEARGRLKAVVARFEDAQWPRCDLLNASYSIPHCDPRDFPGLWARIVQSIRPGGRFAGQLFGVNDEWAKKPDGVTRTYHTRAQVEEMLAGFEVEVLNEQQEMGKNAYGTPKYWHAFHVVARKQ